MGEASLIDGEDSDRIAAAPFIPRGSGVLIDEDGLESTCKAHFLRPTAQSLVRSAGLRHQVRRSTCTAARGPTSCGLPTPPGEIADTEAPFSPSAMWPNQQLRACAPLANLCLNSILP